MMAEITQPLIHPWFVAVWPGMGHVAISAGYYLISKLDMQMIAEFAPQELFDVEYTNVHQGIIQAPRLPRSRCFLWRDPKQKHDLILFIGEAQVPAGKQAFCHSLMQFAKRLGVERVITFAAMATQMHPEGTSRVFCAATSPELLEELTHRGIRILEEGRIGGLNGILLGEAAALGLPGACLLGEMPHIFAHISFPGGSLAVLNGFMAMADVTINLDELVQQAEQLGRKLGEVLAQVEGAIEANSEEQPLDDEVKLPRLPEPKLSPRDEDRLFRMFAEAETDRSKAFELKQELDRLSVFSDYEDQFLDLFKKSDDSTAS
ncbi:MAG: hypothetical protein DWI02_00850 [Planctomycetota bacterium]|nr:MAG: hypothetical protein DWI02_00850 [Planctomycetota bacterium]